QYYAEDFLGSSRVITQNNGAVCYDADFDPYGSEHPYTNNCPSTNAYKFEGKERDSETGNPGTDGTFSGILLAILSCSLAPRTESYDTRIGGCTTRFN
ncbi:MAG: hypothetical protein WBR10_15790, partial [Candidatus Acidiferrum sp.]